MEQLKERIIKWNRDRGLLDKDFDPKLELRLLSEEAHEFYMAETLEHKLCEYTDFLFVKEGTYAKYYSRRIESPSEFFQLTDKWNKLVEWSDKIQREMHYILLAQMTMQGRDDLQECICFTLKTIIENNELKGAETVDGKIVKNADHVDPVEKVKTFLENVR